MRNNPEPAEVRASMIHLAIFIITALSCAITLTASGWSHSSVAGALVCASVAVASVAAWVAIMPHPHLAAWHRARSRSLFERHASISSIFPMAVVAWLALVLIEAMHSRIAEVLS